MFVGRQMPSVKDKIVLTADVTSSVVFFVVIFFPNFKILFNNGDDPVTMVAAATNSGFWVVLSVFFKVITSLVAAVVLLVRVVKCGRTVIDGFDVTCSGGGRGVDGFGVVVKVNPLVFARCSDGFAVSTKNIGLLDIFGLCV